MKNGKYFYATTRWDKNGWDFIEFFESLDDAIATLRSEKDDSYYRFAAKIYWDSSVVKYREDGLNTELYCVDADGDEMSLFSIEKLWLHTSSKKEDTNL